MRAWVSVERAPRRARSRFLDACWAIYTPSNRGGDNVQGPRPRCRLQTRQIEARRVRIEFLAAATDVSASGGRSRVEPGGNVYGSPEDSRKHFARGPGSRLAPIDSPRHIVPEDRGSQQEDVRRLNVDGGPYVFVAARTTPDWSLTDRSAKRTDVH